MYRTRDVKEQAAVVEKHYSPAAHFVDPLMNCKGPQEILLAFFSLIKLFDTVKIEQKSAAFATSPRLPSHLDAAQIQQVTPTTVGPLPIDHHVGMPIFLHISGTSGRQMLQL
jgi:hypothetical protein